MSAVSSHTLSESASKEFLSAFSLPIAQERIVDTPAEAAAAASAIGFPVVAKLNGDRIAHKTERGLVRLNLGSADAVEIAATELLGRATVDDGRVQVLVASQVSGIRELIAGLIVDPVFGPTVMLGVGGVLAEAIADVVFRLVPITPVDAHEMIDQLSTARLLGEFRGEPSVDREALADVLLGLSAASVAHPELVSIDLNPLIVSSVNGRPVAVDALVELRS